MCIKLNQYLGLGQLLEPLQYARMTVAASPCVVDSLTIANLLAADEGVDESTTFMGQIAEVGAVCVLALCVCVCVCVFMFLCVRVWVCVCAHV